MAKRETTKAGTKRESEQQSQSALTSQQELEGKLAAEQDAGERTH